MKYKHIARKPHLSKRAPIWQIIIIILLVIAMPLFFAFIRNSQMKAALMSGAPFQKSTQQPPSQ